MTALYLILYVIAACCFIAAAWGVALSKVNLVALGLLAWVLVDVIATVRAG